jgi:hypothetical protein
MLNLSTEDLRVTRYFEGPSSPGEGGALVSVWPVNLFYSRWAANYAPSDRLVKSIAIHRNQEARSRSSKMGARAL